MSNVYYENTDYNDRHNDCEKQELVSLFLKWI